jgi:hypothetical protein
MAQATPASPSVALPEAAPRLDAAQEQPPMSMVNAVAGQRNSWPWQIPTLIVTSDSRSPSFAIPDREFQLDQFYRDNGEPAETLRRPHIVEQDGDLQVRHPRPRRGR